MISHSIAKRYAKALFAAGEKDGNYRKYLDELGSLLELVEIEPRLKTTLMLPLLEMAKRKDLLSEVVRLLALSPAVAGTVQMLLEKNRISYLPLVKEEYAGLVDEKEGRVKGVLYTAYPLTGNAKTRIEEALSQRLQKKVELTVTEDKELIGGVKVTVGGLRIDGTIRRQLEILNERIMKE
ncbi:MAG TPA: ATP synthase F1 subunit delta [Syntrophorhabdales bacterium]|nr:ATP synthase F1 subunit delta [Syntrophorhabdales bacterium]